MKVFININTMYDKYNSVTNFTVNTTLPKHKGILISGASGSISCTIYVAGQTFGLTAGISVNYPPGTNILPIQVQSVNTIGAGMTAFYLN
jgi:hypothetical protein